jgi:hypothetical protein
MAANDPLGPELAERLERYLDGLLSPEQARAFEQAAAANPALADALATARRIDSSLRSSFDFATPAPAPRLALVKEQAASAGPTARPRARLWRSAAVAAVLALVGGGLLLTLNAGPWARKPFPGPIAAGAAFAAISREGFKPEFVCKTDEEFVRLIRERFADDLSLRGTPEIELVGWSYAAEGRPIRTPYTLAMLCRVKGQEVLVLIEGYNKEDREIKDAGPGRRAFSRRFGSLIVFELTPWDQPIVLDQLHSKNPPSPG